MPKKQENPKLTKKQEKIVQEEVRERLHQKLLRRSKSAALRLKKALRKNTMTAILAAFAFLIALVWRDAIQDSVNHLISLFGISKNLIAYKFITATIITIIAVIGIIIVSKFEIKEEK